MTRTISPDEPQSPDPQPSGPKQPPPRRRSGTGQTRDDTDIGWGELPPPGDAHDAWLREQRPPHWE